MKTTDIFNKTTSKKIVESLEKTFGTRLNLEAYESAQLEDMRNKLRTQVHQFKQDATFNETIENETYMKAQWMLDAINRELIQREEAEQQPVDEGFSSETDMALHKIAQAEDEEMVIDAMNGLMGGELQDAINEIKDDLLDSMNDEDRDRVIDDEDKMAELLLDKIVDEYGDGDFDDEYGAGETDDGYALASAGFGSDEDYESYNPQGEEMNTQVRESATDQASAVVAAKTMVDKVGRWIEELASMENDQLLDLGDTIRDEMGQQQAKAFVSTVSPAIQQALESLKQTRETLANGVRGLTGEEQPEEMLGAEPEAEPSDLGDMPEPADDDAMNPDMDMDMDEPADDFGASEPAAGPDEAGRAKRESIERSNNLLKVLAG